MARMKFLIRDRGFDWLRDEIEKEFANILANGGIAWPETVPEGFGGYQSRPQPLGNGALLPVVNGPQDSLWRRSNVRPQAGRLRRGHREGGTGQPHGRSVARAGGDRDDRRATVWCVSPSSRIWCCPTFPWPVWMPFTRRSTRAGLGESGALEIQDVITCPGAYTCNLGLTKTMNLGAALAETVRRYDDPQVRGLTIKASGCPNSCGHHWIGDFGFYGNARKIDGRELPYYQMLLGGGYDEDGIMRFGLAVQSIPARLAPEAVTRVLDHFLAHRQDGETFRQYVLRYKMEVFRELTADLAKPAELFPEIYQDWGDDEAYSLQLGRGECAA